MDVKLPHLGEGTDSGTVVNLFVKEGDQITKDQPILELENEKAVATIPASAAGTLTKIFVKSGDRISVGQKILSLSDSGAPLALAKSGAQPTTPAKPSSPKAAPQPPVEEETPAQESEPKPEVSVAASPSIRRLARELGLDLSRVRGSAEGGRIVIEDVRAYVQRLQKLAAQPKVAPGASAKPVADSVDFSK